MQIRKSQKVQRTGTTMIETVVAASILVTVISTVTVLAFRVAQMTKQTDHQRLAMIELSNQLEQITRLSPAELPTALQAIQLSDGIQDRLDDAKLSSELFNDAMGTRVTVTLQWREPHPTRPVQLTGWLPTPPESYTPETSSEEAP